MLGYCRCFTTGVSLGCMFDHVEYSVSDIAKARAFYGGICAALGYDEVFFDGKELGLGRGDHVQFLLYEGAATTPNMHICLIANEKESVAAAYEAALTAGGRDNGGPGYRANYGAGYYAAFAFDPDGHNIEMLFREA